MMQEQKLVNITIPSYTFQEEQAQVLWNETLWNDNVNKTCFNLMPEIWCEDMRPMSSLVEEIKYIKHLEDIPVIVGYLGDSSINPELTALVIPAFAKARHSTTLKGLNKITLEKNRSCNKERGWIRKGLDIPPPLWKKEEMSKVNAHYHGIIWPFTLRRHYDKRWFKKVIEWDVPWEKKLDLAVWRGSYTSFDRACLARTRGKFDTFDDECNCNIRCQMVRQNWNSSIANVRIERKGEKIPYHLVEGPLQRLSAGHIPDHFVGEKMSVEE